MRLPVAEDKNCFTTRLKYRLESKTSAQERFDDWKDREESTPAQRTAIGCIDGFYLIYRDIGIIPYPPPIWFAKSKLRPDQIAYLEKCRTEAVE